MKRLHCSYLYSRECGNILVDHDASEADCPIKNCGWVERSERDLLAKLTTHIRIVHNLSYSIEPPDTANQ